MTAVIRHLRADLVVVTRSRLSRIVTASVIVLAGILTGALLVATDDDTTLLDATTAAGQAESLVDPLTGLILACLYAAMWGSAYRDGSILWSYLVGSSRVAIGVSAIIVSALGGLVIAIVAVVVKIAVLHTLVSPPVESSWWDTTAGHLAVGGAVLAGVTLSVWGTALALITRSGVGAVGALLGWLLLAEPILANLLPRDLWLFLPGQALAAIRNAVVDVSHDTAVVTVGIATTALVALALLSVHRRDPA